MGLNRNLVLDNAQEYSEVISDEQYREEQAQLERLPTVFRNRMWKWDDLEWIIRWKTPRSIGYFERNHPDTVDEVIFDVVEASSAQAKVRLLMDLSGIRVKMASAFLLFIDPDEYTVMDWRVCDVLTDEGYLQSSISDDPSIDEYIQYLQVCQSIAEQFGMDLRTLDRGLWVLGGKS